MKAYPYSVRLEVISRYEKGEKKTDISRSLSISYPTVLNWIKRYKSSGKSGLQHSYRHCGSHRLVAPEVKAAAVEMKASHPTWGGAYIRLQLQRQFPNSYIPGARQLQRYFQAAGIVKVATRRSGIKGDKGWAKVPLHRVQVDAKEQLQTQDGHWCSYLSFTDEHSGATLDAFVFPP